MSDRKQFRIGTKCIGWESDDCLVAGADEKGIHSGRLIYYKKSGRARAVMPAFKQFKIAAKGNRKGPPLLDTKGNPSPELALMYALRRDIDPISKMVALKLLQDSMEERGEPFSADEIYHQSQIVMDPEAFRRFVGDWLVSVAMNEGGGQGMRRIAEILDKVDLIDLEPLGKMKTGVLAAIEQCARECKGVPLRREVKKVWIAIGKSQADPTRENENRFETALKEMAFDWLPNG